MPLVNILGPNATTSEIRSFALEQQPGTYQLTLLGTKTKHLLYLLHSYFINLFLGFTTWDLLLRLLTRLKFTDLNLVISYHVIMVKCPDIWVIDKSTSRETHPLNLRPTSRRLRDIVREPIVSQWWGLLVEKGTILW